MRAKLDAFQKGMIGYFTLLAGLLVIVSALTGCAQLFTSKTTALYETPDGRKISYSSDKEQVGLDVKYIVDENGNVKEVAIKVEKSGTQEAVIAAALQQQIRLLQMLETLLPLLKAAATKTPPAPVLSP